MQSPPFQQPNLYYQNPPEMEFKQNTPPDKKRKFPMEVNA